MPEGKINCYLKGKSKTEKRKLSKKDFHYFQLKGKKRKEGAYYLHG